MASKIASFFHPGPYLQKLRIGRQIIKHNGGLLGSFLTLFRTEDLRIGTLVGQDKYGNKYYENKGFFLGRNRYVDYPQSVGWDYDGSQIPAEWHRWLHNTTDIPPTVQPPVNYKWMIDHKENMTGTNQQYVPYSTTSPIIESWVPPKQ